MVEIKDLSSWKGEYFLIMTTGSIIARKKVKQALTQSI